MTPDSVTICGVTLPRQPGGQYAASIQGEPAVLLDVSTTAASPQRWRACVRVLRDNGTWVVIATSPRHDPEAVALDVEERVNVLRAGLGRLP